MTLELSSILPSHDDFCYELHEDPDFVLTVALAVVDHVEIVHYLKEYDQFSFA